MDIRRIVELYTVNKWTLRMIAENQNTDHHKIKRILTNEGIEITRFGRYRKPFTDEHRAKISQSSKGRPCHWKGKPMPKESLYKNMATHLKYGVTYEWLLQFEDIEKLKYLNYAISRKRDNSTFDTATYKKYIIKFYADPQFNRLYDRWVESKNKWQAPSLDHIEPKSKGGLQSVDNLQYVTWFENRAKADIEDTEWQHMKANINEYL